jgi:DNA-binding response OmpR family regulator
MRQGADDYLIKPLQIDVVTASLERAFHKKMARTRGRTLSPESRRVGLQTNRGAAKCSWASRAKLCGHVGRARCGHRPP